MRDSTSPHRMENFPGMTSNLGPHRAALLILIFLPAHPPSRRLRCTRRTKYPEEVPYVSRRNGTEHDTRVGYRGGLLSDIRSTIYPVALVRTLRADDSDDVACAW
jgi:hypothetical protein